MEPLESSDATLTFNEAIEQLAEMTVPTENPLKGRFLIFRKWAPGNDQYIHYYAASPGEIWGMSIRLNYSNTDPNKMQIPYEIIRVTMDSVLGADNVVATEEEFLEYYMNAMAEISGYMTKCMRLIS
jgi:hypothetical protein